MSKADIILKSSNIFTASSDTVISGFVAISGEKIIAVGKPENAHIYEGTDTKIIELGDKVVCPGFVDVHCFFTGYVLGFAGADLSSAKSPEEILALTKNYANKLPANKPILGHGWNSEVIDVKDNSSLNLEFSKRPVILFAKGGETCWMNATAVDTYHFTPDTCYPEAYWRLLEEVLTDEHFIENQFKSYMSMLNSRGITAVKEMGFDDFYSFTDTLEKLEKNKELTLRVSFMSQPVGYGANIAYGKKMKERFKGTFVEFSGFNRMTDGSISCLCGDLKKPYNCAPELLCAQQIDYDMIEKETLEADKENFRFSLHAQGDAAISKVLDIYEKCNRKDGRLVNRHSITDIEFSDPVDLERMGKLGVIAEIYPQIMSITTSKEKIAMIKEKIGMDRGKYYWNRRKMADSGVILSCGTDLPLMFPDIPESIYHACGGFFPEGGEAFNKKNTLTISEILTAWSKGGQYNLYHENILGTLEAGKLADIAVLDGDVFCTDIRNIRKIKVCLTIVDGKIVFNTL
ncbi:amidohydrolase [Clostridium oryzae]|uniref:Adenine deaminase n=1 Tax=Clostridium oryzae TaxID=1450648 RepID=A0A1V4I3J8_9CLOT|nr:amidohydrolase family protein [Clostridium oryzae]OPJ54561.1 adenine deaminase [Clostridium oryzae]